MVDYYRILEVQKTASAGEIKKAYRRLALIWHPDKNPTNSEEANKKFKEISEAYQILCDEKKRKIYDQYGKEGLVGQENVGRGHSRNSRHAYHPEFDFNVNPGFSFVFRDPEDVFREIFGDIIFDFNDGNIGHHHHNGRRNHANPHREVQQMLFGNGLGGLAFGMNDIFGNGGSFTSFSTMNNFNGMNGFGSGGSGGNLKRTSTSTKFINGKKITTKRVYENGKETVMSYENDVLMSKTVNGVPQSITYNS